MGKKKGCEEHLPCLLCERLLNILMERGSLKERDREREDLTVLLSYTEIFCNVVRIHITWLDSAVNIKNKTKLDDYVFNRELFHSRFTFL